MTEAKPSTGTKRGRVLVVDDDADLLQLLKMRLEHEGYTITTAGSVDEAQSLVLAERPDVVVTDLKMDPTDGLALLEHLQRELPSLPVIVLTAHGTISDAIRATQGGAFGFVEKPIEKADLLAALEHAMETYGARAADADGTRTAGTVEFVTRSPRMEALLGDARRAAASEVAVLIEGQTGTGKDVLGRFVHATSRRAAGAFIAVNCAAIPEALFEAELFGHVRGAFTGASRDRKGLIAAADGGTLFLDEVGELPLAMQVKLLRVLEDGEVRPVGRTTTDPVNVRLVSATNRDLEDAIAESTFREDLYYRLNVVRLVLPPLDERREDIPLLVGSFLAAQNARTGNPKVYAPEAMELLVAARWPGNVRQLQNVVQRNVALAPSPVISVEQVRAALSDDAPDRLPSYDEARDEFTRQYLVQLLQITEGNVTRAARLAKRNRTDFYKLLQRHAIRLPSATE